LAVERAVRTGPAFSNGEANVAGVEIPRASAVFAAPRRRV
jgi:hypothetical protein